MATPTLSPERTRALLRSLFLLLLLGALLLNAATASAQSSHAQQRSARPIAWGLLPLHIDRGIDHLSLPPETRSRIDSLRSLYLAVQDSLSTRIVEVRGEMLAQIRAGEGEDLTVLRQEVRELMIDLRQGTDRYGEQVALLLEPDQIALLLDPDVIWGASEAVVADEGEIPGELSPFATPTTAGMSYSRPDEHEQRTEE